MMNSQFSFVLITSIIATSLGSSLLVSSIGSNLVYTTTSLSQSIQQSQDELQSAINKEVQQTITDTIININNSNSAADQSNDSQTQNSTPLPPFQQKAAIIDNMPSQKVRVGDIDIAYKQLGQGVNHIVLITGLGATMDMWSPDLLTKLSRNNTVIIFDNRGAGESTIGTKDFSISQFSNDTRGLLDALYIEKADILGWSMGAFTSQELASMYADRVNNLILYASSCGGPNAVPANPEVRQAFENNTLTPQEFAQKSTSLLFPDQWFSANPNYLNYFPIPHEFVSREVIDMQIKSIGEWSGNCQALGNITSPTMVIVETDDIFTPAENSINIIKEIPGAWLVQIEDAGHGLMYQYPETFTNIVETFLNVTDTIS